MLGESVGPWMALKCCAFIATGVVVVPKAQTSQRHQRFVGWEDCEALRPPAVAHEGEGGMHGMIHSHPCWPGKRQVLQDKWCPEAGLDFGQRRCARCSSP